MSDWPPAVVWLPAKPALLAAITVLSAAFSSDSDRPWSSPVSAKLPGRIPQPDRFVVVDRTGGRRMDPVTDAANIRVDCYALTPEQGELMAVRASEALHNAAGESFIDPDSVQQFFIRGWNENSVANYPNPDIVDRERWQVFGTLLVKAN